MPIHDWTRVNAGIFHAFHHGWIEEIARALNRGLLPPDHYALPEQHAMGLIPDVLTLQLAETDGDSQFAESSSPQGNGGVLLAPPKLQPVAETDVAAYRRKQKTVTVRHVSGHRIVAVVEIVSPGNKAGRNPMQAFVTKAAELLEQQIHLLILDLIPPSARDPSGIHDQIWEEITGQADQAPAENPLTLAAYEAGMTLRAYVVPVEVGESLPNMPLFLEPEKAVDVPLEASYMAAYHEMPRHWRLVVEGAD